VGARRIGEGVDVRALTLWRPWPWAIFHAPTNPKRIENRPWKPWPSIIGKRIVLHAGKAFQKEAVDDILDSVLLKGEPRVLPASAVHEGLIGVVTVTGFVESAEDAAMQAGQGQERWWSGPYAWVLTDVRAFKEPIKCKGSQGLWLLEPWQQRAVDDALKDTKPEPAPYTGPF
jgi:hypothetical protein